MVDGRTGRSILLWKDENNFGGHTRFGKLLAGVAGAQVASTSSGQTPPAPHGGSIRLVSFENGLDRPHFRIRQSLPGDFYSPLMLFDDLDADGAVEMVVISHEALWTFDTGERPAEVHGAIRADDPHLLRHRRLGEALARRPAPLAGHDQPPSARGSRRSGRTASPGPTTLWKVVVGGKEDQYQSAIRIVPGGPDVVSDLDGDGRYEVLASITNEHGDRSQHLVVFDASTGRRLAEAGDERILSVDDLDGDGRPEVLLQEASRLRLAHWNGDGFIELWQRRSASSRSSGRSPPRDASAAPAGGNTPRLARIARLGPLPVPVPRRRQRLPARGKPGRPRQAGRHSRGTRKRRRCRDPRAEQVTWDGRPS